ncbi:MAG TPA: tetratricopeptide repeat protein [Vicinamibacterales bacterium]|nr:tetratricopeptide repeat protein [Vicinamibacterales bacterium]
MLPLLALLATAAPAADQASPVPPLPAPRILVVPFEAPPRDGRTYWLGEGVALLIADDINARALGAITRTSRERAYEQLHLPASAVLSRATVIKVGEIVGASQVIAGEVSVDGDAFTIRGRSIRIDVGRADGEIVERGRLADLFAVVQRAARRLVPGGSDAGAGPAPSLQAFEQFVKGLLAEQPASQAAFLEAALKLEPGYDRARLALWEVRTAQGDHAAALAAVRAVNEKARWSRRARFVSAVSMTELQQFDDAFTTLKALNDAEPSAAIFNNLGVIQIRRGGTEAGRPTYFLTKAAELDPDDPDILFNLGYAYALDRDPQGAIYWLREALRRNPADGDAHVVLAAALDSSGSTVEAARERELAQQLSTRHADAAAAGDRLPRGLERARQDMDPVRGSVIDRAITSTAQRDQQELARFHLERGRRLYEQERDREAAGELRRAVFLSPYEAEAHLLLGRIDLRGGRPQDAVAALKISIWSKDTPTARVALADAYLRLKDTASARTHAQKALAMDPTSLEAATMLRRIEGGG